MALLFFSYITIDMGKRCLLFIAALFVTTCASACLSAHQNRIFPIGISSRGLVVLEVHLERSDDEDGGAAPDELDPVWYGKVYCNTYKDYELQESDTLGILKDFKESELAEKLKEYLSRCIDKAKALPQFVKAQREMITFYGYSAGAGVKVISDTVKQTASVRVTPKHMANIPIFSSNFPLYEDYQSYFGEVDDTAAYVASLETGLLVGSVRKYTLGKQALYIVHLESGQLYPDPENEKKVHAAESKHFTDTGLFTEPVMHHGHGFDFYILE